MSSPLSGLVPGGHPSPPVASVGQPPGGTLNTQTQALLTLALSLCKYHLPPLWSGSLRYSYTLKSPSRQEGPAEYLVRHGEALVLGKGWPWAESCWSGPRSGDMGRRGWCLCPTASSALTPCPAPAAPAPYPPQPQPWPRAPCGRPAGTTRPFPGFRNCPGRQLVIPAES